MVVERTGFALPRTLLLPLLLWHAASGAEALRSLPNPAIRSAAAASALHVCASSIVGRQCVEALPEAVSTTPGVWQHACAARRTVYAIPMIAKRSAAPLMLAKKKQKLTPEAEAALAALDAFESIPPPGMGGDDDMAPVAPKSLKKKKAKNKPPPEAAAALEALEAFEAGAAAGEDDGMTPVTPKPLKKKGKKALAPEAAAALEALETMEASGGAAPLAGDDEHGNVSTVVAKKPKKGKSKSVLEENVEEDEQVLGPAVTAAAATAETETEVDETEYAAESDDDESAEEGVRLSKKKQGKKKKAADGEEPVSAVARDQSGRRGMGLRVETFDNAPPGFAYVKISDGKLRFRNQDVLTAANWDLQTGQRIGLVGNNGAGKTTQLRILAGEIELDGGEIVKSSSDIKIAMLRQEFREDLREDRTLKEEMISVFTEVQALRDEYEKAEAALASAGDDADAMQSALDSMAATQSKLDAAGAESIERRADSMIGAMGFTAADAELPVSAFSGGWKMRIGLGKTLLSEPQVLLLDEPTNHMDLESVEWLENYLTTRTEKLALVVVSHDREFLDRVCTKIVETEFGVTYSYNGNYRAFLKQKEQRVALATEAWEKQQKEIRALKSDISKLRKIESAAASMRAKERQLKEMQEGGSEHVPKPFVPKRKFNFRFPPAPRCSQEVIELEDVSHGYGDSTLFSDIDLVLERGDRVAILGPNGAGKSTLLRLLMGKEKPRHGRAQIVASNAVMQYFEQDQANALPLDKTVLQTLEDASRSTDFRYEELRALLGKFMFKGEKADDLLSTLSGGEKARVALCRMMLTPANLLILDEPTNHLDIAAKEVLEEALQHFEGTVVMVSHDRYFVSQTATTILALEDGKLVVYDGDYRSYMEQNEKTKGMVEKRYIEGLPTIQSAPKIELQPEDSLKMEKKKKNFGGKGQSGNKMKGVKNAKRQAALK